MWIGFVLGLALACITYSLGQWQTSRAAQKTQLYARQVAALHAPIISSVDSLLDINKLAYRQLELKGHFVPHALVYIDNRQFNGKPAVQVIQAFEPEGQPFVIPVDRGFLLRNATAPRRAPDLPTQALGNERVLLKATLLPHFARSAELRGVSVGDSTHIHKEQNNGYAVWSNFSFTDFASEVKMPVSNFAATLEPVVVASDAQALQAQQPDQTSQGFYLASVPLAAQVARHEGYAFQWYAMTVALVLLTLFFVHREWPR